MNIVYKFSKIEISRRIFWVLLGGLVFAYLMIGLGQIQQPECFGHMRCFDYDRRERDLSAWKYSDFWDQFSSRYSLTFLLLKVSEDVFSDSRILPMASSAGFIVVVGLFGSTITNSRTFGIVPAFLVLVDPIFLSYSTSITYPNFWASVFMIGALLIFSRSSIGCGVWLLSSFFKIINLAYLPVIVLLSDWSRKRKMLIILFMFGILFSGTFMISKFMPEINNFKQFKILDFAYGLSMWSYDMKDDQVGLVMIFAALFFCIILNKYKVMNSGKLLACIIYLLVTPAITSAFTSFTIEPYRFLVLIGFVYVGVSLGLRNIILIVEDLKKFGKKN